MSFINPIELLDLQFHDPANISNAVIKKAKSRLFAEIELSDEEAIDYKGTLVTKQECDQAIDQLDSKLIIEYYFYLANNQPLNNFLAVGAEDFFRSFTEESIYKDVEFISFINPLYTERLSKIISKAFRDNDQVKLSLALKVAKLVPFSEQHILFKGINHEIDIRLDKLRTISEEIKEDRSSYDKNSVGDLVDVIKQDFSLTLINTLPIQYFQSKISKIASSINRLGSIIWDTFHTPLIPLALFEHLLKLNIDSAGKPTFEKNYEFIRQRAQEHEEKERYAPILKKWVDIYDQLQSLKIDVENEHSDANAIFDTVQELVTISELNSLGKFADDIRTKIAYAVRGLSIASWNTQDDVTNALRYINLSLKIRLDNDDISNLKKDQSELIELEKKHGHLLKCFFCGNNAPNLNSTYSNTIYKETSRSYFPRRSVQFSCRNVSIPRCDKCKDIHTAGSDSVKLVVIVCLIIGGIVGAFTEDHRFILGGIIGAVIGWIIGKGIESNKYSAKGIKDTSSSTIGSYPSVSEYIKQGWTFSKPTA